MKKFVLLFTLILTACTSYNVQVDLTPEEIATYEEQIAEYTDLIENFNSDELDVTGDASIGGAVEATTVSSDKPKIDWFVGKARAQQSLGRVDDALRTYESVFSKYGYESSKTTRHNLAKIYHNAGECELAKEQYLILVNFHKMPQYYYDIAHCYMRHTDNKEEAEKYYTLHREAGGHQDSEIREFISS